MRATARSRCPLLGSHSYSARCFQSLRCKPAAMRRSARRRIEIKAGLPDGNSLAVLQQGTAFGEYHGSRPQWIAPDRTMPTLSSGCINQIDLLGLSINCFKQLAEEISGLRFRCQKPAFARAGSILVVAEGFYTRTQLPEEAPGRPSVLPIFAGVTGLIAAMVLLKLEQGEALGLVVGGVCSGLLLLLNIKRSIDTADFRKRITMHGHTMVQPETIDLHVFVCQGRQDVRKADPSEFPGPKAWPIFVSTGAFFAMLAFLESFQYLS